VTLLAFVGVDPGVQSAAAAVASSGTTATVIFRAAAAVNTQGRIEVRLRWSLEDGWLPDGGFNVYRFDGSVAGATTTPLNGSPLGGVTAANAPVSVRTGALSVPLASLLGKAAASGSLPTLSTTVVRGASGQARFDQLTATANASFSAQATQAMISAAAAQATVTAAAATVSTAGGSTSVSTPKAQSGSAASSVVASTAKAAASSAVKRAAPSATDIAMQARRTLLMSAALHPEVAALLGTAFDDPNVKPGQTYTYRLTAAKDGTQFATVTITVPTATSGLKPLAPTGLQAQQLNAGSIALRWHRLSVTEEAALGVADYDIYRSSASDPSTATRVPGMGIKQNGDTPVVVTDNIGASDASGAGNVTGTEAAAFFTDTSPPAPGSATYSVTVTDIFGRTSDPVQVTLNVQNWHKPLPVPFVAAQLLPQQAAQQSAFMAARAQQYHVATPFFKSALAVAPPSQQALVVWTPSGQNSKSNTIFGSSHPAGGVGYQIYRIDTEQPNQAPVLLTPTPINPALIPAQQLPGRTPETSIPTLIPNVSFQANSAKFSLAVAACVFQSGSTAQSCAHTLSEEAGWEDILLSPLYVQTYTDTTPVKDHYYQYLVVAVFRINSLQSTPSSSNVVAYPNLTPPAPVSNAGSTFQVQTIKPQSSSTASTGSSASGSAAASGSGTAVGTSSGGTGGTGTISQAAAKSAAASSAKSGSAALAAKGGVSVSATRGLTLTNWTGPLVKALPKDWGGNLTLTWTPGTQDAKYQIYRANATRPNPVTKKAATSAPTVCPGGSSTAGSTSGSTASSPTTGAKGSSGSSQTSPVAKQTASHGSGAAQAVLACTKGMSVAAVALSWQTLGDPLGAVAGAGLKDSDFELLGTTKNPQFVDELSRSSAEYYVYRIVPLNRWNVPGPLVSLGARVPATLPPTKPKLLVGTAGPDGGVQVEFVPVGDSGEEIIRYELWRSTLKLGTSLTGSSATAGATASTGSASGTNAATSNAGAASAYGTATDSTGAVGTYGSAGDSTAAGTAASSVPSAGSKVATLGGVTARSAALANSAAHYGVVTRSSAVSAALQTGVGPLSGLTPEQLTAMSATQVAHIDTANLPAGSGNGAWITESPSSALDWRNEYVYWVRAIDSDSLQSDSDLVDVEPLKVSASAPAALRASWNATRCSVDLTWQGTDRDTAGFLIERELAPSTSGAAVAVTPNGQKIPLQQAQATLLSENYIQLSGITQPTATSYSDTTAFADNSYFYRVRTLDQAGNESDPTVLSAAIAIPDGCGDTSIHQVQKTSAAGTSSSGNASPSGTVPASGNTESPPAPSRQTVTEPKPADQITVPGSIGGSGTSTPVVTPPAPSVPKPADEIVIPETRQ